MSLATVWGGGHWEDGPAPFLYHPAPPIASKTTPPPTTKPTRPHSNPAFATAARCSLRNRPNVAMDCLKDSTESPNDFSEALSAVCVRVNSSLDFVSDTCNRSTSLLSAAESLLCRSCPASSFSVSRDASLNSELAASNLGFKLTDGVGARRAQGLQQT